MSCGHRSVHELDTQALQKAPEPADTGTPTQKRKAAHTGRRWVPLMLIALSAFGFSIQALLVRELTIQGLGTFQIVEVRGCCQALGCCVVLLAKAYPMSTWLGSSAQERKALTARAVVGYGGVAFGFLAISLMPLADSQIVSQTAPIFSAAFARIFLGEEWHLSEFFSALTGIVGVIFISKPEMLFGETTTNCRHLLGVAFGLLSALCSGGAYVIIRFLGTAVKVDWTVVLLAQAVGQMTLSPACLVAAGQHVRIFSSGLELLLVLIIGFMGFSSQCAMTIGMQKEKSATASLVRQSLCPVFALLWQGLFFPKDALAWTSFAGFCTILLGLTVTVISKALREGSDAKPKTSNYSQVAASEAKQEDGTPSKLDHARCLPTLAHEPVSDIYGKRSFFDEAPGMDRENQMIECLQKEGFSRRQAELALTEVGWSSPKDALDILLDCKYMDQTVQEAGEKSQPEDEIKVPNSAS